jgi:hypothetical protein
VVADTLCHHGVRVNYRIYPDLWHDTIPGVGVGIDDGAMPDILAWTSDRFAGAPAATNCSERTPATTDVIGLEAR